VRKALSKSAAVAVLATALFSVSTYAVEQLGWNDALGLSQQAAVFVIVFVGMLWMG
jgi:hypothetical protein